MPRLIELAHEHTDLEQGAVEHLAALVSEWGMLADFCFADMLLYIPVAKERWLISAQVRAATGQTLYHSDYVNTWASDTERILLDKCIKSNGTVQGEIFVQVINDSANMLAIPVRYKGRIIAVLSREWVVDNARRPGQLETTYAEIFSKFAEMVAQGLFPFDGRVADASVAPRVGDGVIVLDAATRVRYASPNAVSALHRVGVSANAIGQTLAELGVAETAARNAYERKEPVIEEIEQTTEVTLLTRSIPLLRQTNDDTEVTGGVLLLRDVSELRHRDRLLLTKDATIREIHHRVKNNLQTISSLLRLQGRRLTSPEAKEAVAESVRRIRTIALVHETLSREPGEDISFIEIVRPLMRLVEEGLQSADRPVTFQAKGDGGRLPATIATPLSVVILELLQNAVDHGFPEGSAGGAVMVVLSHDEDELRIEVVNNGIALSRDFDFAKATGLGLSIVRTLVTTELAGTIEMRQATQADGVSSGVAMTKDGQGTVVELRLPVSA
ncbi:MAG: histidine kinase N-terminal domain-containing protein, partial [Ilumatobacteraceae bacterium]